MRPSLSPSRASQAASSGLVDDRILGGRDVAGRILQHGGGNPQGDCRPVRRRSGDDGVVVIGKFLRFLEALSPASRAAVPVGKSGRAAVEGLDDGLRLHGHFVLGAPREVDELFRMIERKRPAAPHMPGVGGRARIPCADGVGHGGIADHAGPASVADSLELAVPAVRRQPDFHFDI